MSEPLQKPRAAPRLVVNRPAEPVSSSGRAPADAHGAAPQEARQPAPPRAPAADAANPVAIFLELEIEARQCTDLDSLRFAIVNATRKLVAFEQAVLFEPGAAGAWKITRASSVNKVDRHAPAMRILESWLNASARVPGFDTREARILDLAGDTGKLDLKPDDLPFTHGFWLPIKTRDGRILAGLLSLKREPWRPQATSILAPLAGAYAHAWAALEPKAFQPAKRALGLINRKRLALASLTIAAACAFVPVPMSSLAPAEIVAAEPSLVTAPLDGVVHILPVSPGTFVEKDALIVAFEDTKLRSDVEVAKRNKGVAQARYFRIVQTATATQKEGEDLAVAKAELALATAELAHAESLLARTQVRAPRSGLLIYSTKSEWIGKPVSTGERIMEIGDPAHTELRIDMPVSDAISLSQGADVALFLDGDPLNAIAGRVSRTSYRPSLTPDHQLVYKVYATLSPPRSHRIGLRGVARVSNTDVPLWFYLFRRPIAGMRQRFGL